MRIAMNKGFDSNLYSDEQLLSAALMMAAELYMEGLRLTTAQFAPKNMPEYEHYFFAPCWDAINDFDQSDPYDCILGTVFIYHSANDVREYYYRGNGTFELYVEPDYIDCVPEAKEEIA